MKWLFLLTVLANAGFVAWLGFSAADSKIEKGAVYGPPVSEKIYLIGEEHPDSNVALSTNVYSNVPASTAESVADEVGQAVNSMLKNNAAAVIETENLLCPVVVLERDADRRLVTEALKEEKIAFTQQETTGKRDKFWLYISAPATTAQAQDIVARLKLKRIDSYIISRGDMKNRISLGLFSSQERAEQAQVSITERSGMPVNVYPHQRSVKLYELLLDQPIIEQAWENFLQTLDLSKLLIKIEKNPC
ncbi:MAG: SPOR domain-containing protein [Marinomonas atlantica]|nr:SPOR domain-containing protein [Marinomonas atlantica]